MASEPVLSRDVYTIIASFPISRGIEPEYNQGRIGMLSQRTGNLTSRVVNPVILTMLAA